MATGAPILRVLAAVIMLALPLSAAAELPGQDAAPFRAALDRWLGDDETALEAMAGLARDGNRAAQVLLALVDMRVDLQGPRLASLDRAARRALLRQPQGISGRSWMEAAVADTELARLWMARLRADTPPETVLAFARMGEARAARDTVIALAARQENAAGALALAPEYPPELRHLAWREWGADPAQAARIEAEIAALLPGDPQITAFRAGPVTRVERLAWLTAAPLAAPLRAFCDATCPESGGACLRATYAMVRGLGGLARVGTPSETLIAPEVWNASPLGRAALLRRAEARERGQGGMFIADVAGLDACTAGALADETLRFLR